MQTIILLLLPALAYGRISIRVRASDTESKSSVEYLGSNIDIISDTERKAFGIEDSDLKDAVRSYSGGRPQDVYVRSPTPWDDLYKRFRWDEIQRTLYPKSARILGVHTEPVIVSSQEFVNNSTVKAKYNAGISQQVENTVSNSWSKNNEISVGQEISYGIEIGVGNIGGSTSMSYTHSWGEEKSESKAITVGSSSGVEIELEPGQAVIATLQATRGTMKVQVEYTANLNGDVACNYGAGRFQGHYFWAYDINAVLSAANKPRSVDSTEVLTIGFYSDAKITVADKRSSNKILESPAAFF